MKRIFAIALLAIAVTAQANAHSVTLSWTASADSTTAVPGTVTIYRAVGACPASGIGTLTYTALSTTAAAGGPYTDSTVTAGTTYCYYITATIAAATSGPSNTVAAIIPISPPTILVVVAQ